MRRDHLIDDQSYRVRITRAITEHVPDARVYDPWALSPGSVDFDAETAFRTFHTHLQQAGKTDALIAYLPTASMGTAMEMWQAYQNGVPIIAVSPLHHHWAIRFTARKVLPDPMRCSTLSRRGICRSLCETVGVMVVWPISPILMTRAALC